VKPQRAFIAERVAAQHCQKLLARSPDPADLIPALTALGERIARQLAGALATLPGGDALDVSLAGPDELGQAKLAEEVGPLAANILLATATPDLAVLASIEALAVLRMVERAFGGRGEVSGALPASFPHSAELMIERLEQLVAQCLGEALCQDALRPLRRDSNLTELAPFPAKARLTVLRFTVAEAKGKPWQMLIALPQAQLAKFIDSIPLVRLPKLLGDGETGMGRVRHSADPAAAPFAQVPLPLIATLVDMQVPLSILAALEPGTVLPVTVARAVPLSISGTVLARGTIGAQDDRIAIKLSQLA
jgi:flagellar motor switch protein FliM